MIDNSVPAVLSTGSGAVSRGSGTNLRFIGAGSVGPLVQKAAVYSVLSEIAAERDSHGMPKKWRNWSSDHPDSMGSRTRISDAGRIYPLGMV
jgi:hypothetical protein